MWESLVVQLSSRAFNDFVMDIYLSAMIITLVAWVFMRNNQIHKSIYVQLVEQMLLLWFVFEGILFVVCKMGSPRKIADVVANFGYDFSVLLLAVFLFVPQFFRKVWLLPALLIVLMALAFGFNWQMSYSMALVFFELAIVLLSFQLVKLARSNQFNIVDFVFLVFIILDDMFDMSISYLVHYTDWMKHESLVVLMSTTHLVLCILFLSYYLKMVISIFVRHLSSQRAAKNLIINEDVK